MSYERALRTALDAAEEAGEILRREFHRWGGPRGFAGHADADEEAEWIIRKRLLAAFPDYRYRGEETGSVKGSDPHVWLVDPNDGTSAYLRGARGSSVSIGLVRSGIPVLGVVYAFSAPDDRGDLIYWAEGFELTRNGFPIKPRWDIASRNHVIVLVSVHRENIMEAVLDTLQPFRYRAFPSIAYRLALAAVGDGEAAVSWHHPGDWDYAGGHALIRGAGGIFINEEGAEVTYADDGVSKVTRCFGGEPSIVRDLSGRNWNKIQSQQANPPVKTPRSLFTFARLKPGKSTSNSNLLSRAQGCLAGQLAGDALGQMVEFLDPQTIQRRFTKGLSLMQDGGAWGTMAGQATDDSELALMLARCIARDGLYIREHVAQSYYYWLNESGPFDVGSTIAKAIRSVSEEDLTEKRVAEVMTQKASRESQANGSLMRISPLGILGYRMNADKLWQLACEDSLLTHPHHVCQQSCALYVSTIADAIQSGRAPKELYERALKLAEQKEVDPSLMEALKNASVKLPEFGHNAGWVLVAFQNAFYQLLHAKTFEEGLVQTVLRGFDSDTNAAIAGALLGAVHGRDAIPFQWRQMVFSCRPHPAPGIQNPRPYCFWPVDRSPQPRRSAVDEWIIHCFCRGSAFALM